MNLYVLVGMIGSGKSTYARKRADDGAIVVCHDDLTAMLHARYRYEQGLKPLYRRMEESLAHYALINNKDVIVDRTHLTRESRARWVELAGKLHRWLTWGVYPEMKGSPRVVAVEFPRKIAYVHAMRRYEADPRGRPFADWLRVALHHQDQAEREPLADDEGFDEVIRIREEGR